MAREWMKEGRSLETPDCLPREIRQDKKEGEGGRSDGERRAASGERRKG